MIRVQRPEGSFLIDDAEYKQNQQAFNSMFMKAMEKLKDIEEVDYLYFGTDRYTGSGKKAMQIVTKLGTMYVPNVYYDDRHLNDDEVVNRTTSEYAKIVADCKVEIKPEDHFSGVFKLTGKMIQFNRVFGTYRFSDEECQTLLEGKKLMIATVSKSGYEYYAYGGLVTKVYERFVHWGFDPMMIFKSFNGHQITKEEAKKLFDGETLTFSDLISKKNNSKYSANVNFDTNTKKLVMKFENKKFDNKQRRNRYVNYDPVANQEVDYGYYDRYSGWVDYDQGKNLINW